jgi:hypothetical protein
MANTKISALPTYTGNTTGAYLVMDDSALAQSYKVTKETLLSNGATPNWIAAGTVQSVGLSGVTTSPTIPTATTKNQIYYQQIGPKTYQVQGVLKWTSNTGGADGSGDYLFTLPAGLSFDLTNLQTQVAYSGVVTSSYVLINNYLFDGWARVSRDNGNYGGSPGFVSGIIPYNNTQYRVLIESSGGGIYAWNSGWFQMTAGPQQNSWSFTFQST